jgi:hypothetical protein
MPDKFSLAIAQKNHEAQEAANKAHAFAFSNFLASTLYLKLTLFCQLKHAPRKFLSEPRN